MKRFFVRFLSAYLALVLMMVLLKPAFMLVYSEYYSGSFVRSMLSAVWHGLPMDLSMAAYLMVVPALLMVVSLFCGPRPWLRRTERVWYGIVAALVAAAASLDFILYGYWDFRLDATPLFYFFSSPASAMASATVGEIVLGLLGWAAGAALFYALLYYCAVRRPWPEHSRQGLARRASVAILMTVALFIPIRGGVTVSTMNLSRAYFSSDMRLNHAAINPVFSLMVSLTMPDDFRSQFRFFDDDEAERLAAPLMATGQPADSMEHWLRTDRPDVYLLILESFSSHLMPSLGGDSVAVRLDALAAEGILFTHAYASGFRTDRGIPAVLSGVPAQPTESIMKHVAKAERLPGLAAELAAAGYECSYYYGGDANFTNMLAYLRAGGFGRIVCDRDFPISERASKWGAPDGPVLERAFADARGADGRRSRFAVVQTSSSHEPFDVPGGDRRFPEGPLRAFSYADSCVGAFVDSLRTLPSWNRTLVIAVPDHYGCYPKPLDSIEARHRVPLILMGGAVVPEGLRIGRIASQTDIPATLLGQLGLPHDRFPFSRDLAVPGSAASAYMCQPEQVMLVTDGENAVLNVTDDAPGSSDASRRLAAYLQVLYNYIDSF